MKNNLKIKDEIKVSANNSLNCVFCRVTFFRENAIFFEQYPSLYVIKDKLPLAKKHFLCVHKQCVCEIQMIDSCKFMRDIKSFCAKYKLKNYQMRINHGQLQHIKHLHAHIISNSRDRPL